MIEGFLVAEFWVWLLATGASLCAITLYGIATLEFRFGTEALEIVALGVPFRAIRYEDVESAGSDGSVLCEHWMTFRWRNRVTLRLRGGRRRVIITPPDPAAFLRELQHRLAPAPARRADRERMR